MPDLPKILPVDLAVLDIAGTTVEEHGAVYIALAEATRAAGGAPSDSDIERHMGADKTEALQALLTRDGAVPTAETVAVAYEDFTRRLSLAYAERPPAPLPGVPDAIRRMRSAGVRVCLTTGFSRDVTGGLLEIVGWTAGVVDAVVCAEEVGAGRPAPYMVFEAMRRTGTMDVRRVAVAGDTVRDLQAGNNAGAGWVVGVLTGALGAEALGRERHTHLLPGVAALPEVLGL